MTDQQPPNKALHLTPSASVCRVRSRSATWAIGAGELCR